MMVVEVVMAVAVGVGSCSSNVCFVVLAMLLPVINFSAYFLTTSTYLYIGFKGLL